MKVKTIWLAIMLCIFGGFIGGLGGSWILQKAHSSKMLLYDKEGMPKIVLRGTDGSGEPSIEVLGKDGRSTVIKADGLAIHGGRAEGNIRLGVGSFGACLLVVASLREELESLPESVFTERPNKEAVEGIKKKIKERLKQGITLFVPPDGRPYLSVRDRKGYSAILGAYPLEIQGTGETIELPASSLVLFNNDGTLKWKAP